MSGIKNDCMLTKPSKCQAGSSYIEEIGNVCSDPVEGCSAKPHTKKGAKQIWEDGLKLVSHKTQKWFHRIYHSNAYRSVGHLPGPDEHSLRNTLNVNTPDPKIRAVVENYFVKTSNDLRVNSKKHFRLKLPLNEIESDMEFENSAPERTEVKLNTMRSTRRGLVCSSSTSYNVRSVSAEITAVATNPEDNNVKLNKHFIKAGKSNTLICSSGIDTNEMNNIDELPPVNSKTVNSIAALDISSRMSKSSHNLCYNEKLRLRNASVTSELSKPEALIPIHSKYTTGAGAFCTVPRHAKSSYCSFYTVDLEKGTGKKSLGFTIVGGRDSPKGALGIFIKSILPTGQATDDGRLMTGDEILAVNGTVCHDLSHHDAVRLFKSVKVGRITLNVCRRHKIIKENTGFFN